MTERDILYEAGDYWISRDTRGCHVWKNGHVAATCSVSFPLTDDGMSLAREFIDYRVYGPKRLRNPPKQGVL